MDDLKGIWAEKYRPTQIEDLILSGNDRKILESFIEKEEIPNLLFYGKAGTGKTTAGKILISHLQAEDLFLNCAEVGIDDVRNTITSFSKTRSFNGRKKIVFLDEIDSASSAAQKGLRNSMEENAAYCRYILTSNYIHDVILPLQSRCQTVQLSPPINLIVKRIGFILKNENIQLDDDNRIKLLHIIKKFYPDVRKTINEVQKYCVGDKLVIPDFAKTENFLDEILKLIFKKKELEARKLLIEKENDFNCDYSYLMKNFFDVVYNLKITEKFTETKKKMCLVAIGEYMYKSSFVVDQEINFYCLILALSSILNS